MLALMVSVTLAVLKDMMMRLVWLVHSAEGGDKRTVQPEKGVKVTATTQHVVSFCAH